MTITGFTGSDAPGVLLDNDTTITLKNVTFRDMNLTDHPHKDSPATAGSAIQAWSGAGVLMEVRSRHTRTPQGPLLMRHAACMLTAL